ncbi:MAG: tRNA (adenosine(37)-N6)-dimethylallyltransferase MiaA [Victivallales bacterium]
MKEKKIIKIIAVLGPTATGKTKLAVRLAREFNGEIISADSRQVYRGLNIGSGKDIVEYEDIPYHMIDVVNPSEDYNLMRFRSDVPEIILGIDSRGHIPIIAGGSSLYINALLSEYSLRGGAPIPDFRESLKNLETKEILEMLKNESEDAYKSINDQNNRNRIIRYLEKAKNIDRQMEPLPFTPESLLIGVFFDRKDVHSRIEKRLDLRLKGGMIEEVEDLHNNGISWEKLEFFGLEYRYVACYLQGKLSFMEMRKQLLEKIRQFAKRQDVWFRKMEREGKAIYWVKDGNPREAGALVDAFLNNHEMPEPEIRISEIYYGKKSS